MTYINKSKLFNLLENQGDFSLYIHIPFCTKKCHYCAFYSEAKCNWNNNDFVQKYFDKLIKEIDCVKTIMKNESFKTVFIGGGNPGVLEYDRIRELLIHIGLSEETTFEINPESLSLEYIQLFKQGLANRISVGIQSMDDDILYLLGRNAKVEDNIKALKILNKISSLEIKKQDNYFYNKSLFKESLFKEKIEVSIDLMTCLPTQSIQMAKDDINKVLSYIDLNHLSLYCLTVEEGTYLRDKVLKGKVKVQTEETQKQMLENLWLYLKELGFEHYEISNFARNKKYSKHNFRYWKLKPYLGLGSFAASTLVDKNKLIRLNQEQRFIDYIKSDLFENYSEEVLEKKEQLEEYLLVALRTNRGLEKRYLREKFSIDDALIRKIFINIDKEYYNENEDFIFFNEKGFMMLDSFILEIALKIDKLCLL